MHQRKLAAQPRNDSTPKKFRKGYDECPSCGGPKIRRFKNCRKCVTKKRRPPDIKRTVFVEGEPCRLIPLTQGQYAIVNRANYERLMQWPWYAIWAPNTKTFYARRNGINNNGKRGGILMHRVIVGARRRELYDHCNGNTLDNRVSNLRKCTIAQNNCNTRMRKDNTSGHRGVHWYPKYQKWMARVSANGKGKTIGYFAKIEDAIKARNDYAALHHGDFARFD